MTNDKTQDQQETKAKPKKRSRSSGNLMGISIFGKIVGIVVIVWLISISYYAFAFFALGMFPSILSTIIDRGSGRFASKTVSACNFVSIVPYLFDIALSYERDLLAKQLMSDAKTWLIIYGFAAIGWLLIWILPNTFLIIFTARADLKTKSLLRSQERLFDEWGSEVKTGKPRKAPKNA